MEKNYNHKENEDKIYNLWEKNNTFAPSLVGKPFTVLMPPPNANASLHAGHAMYTIDDIIVRFKRMQGYSVLWVPGMDHAGFETQFVYEKHLAKEGKSRMDYDRDTLYKNIYQFVKENSGLIYEQFKKLGFSAHWERSVFTLDQNVIDRVYDTFSKMEKEEYVYRDTYIVNYCVSCGTSLAELEVKRTERIDTLYFINYPFVEEDGGITVATVRPETIFGDSAIAVHPEDDRYKTYIGKKVKIPFTTREIPVIADSSVDMEFGTGALKVTPSHDPADFELARKHNLEKIRIIDLRGKIYLPNDVHFPEIISKKAKEARVMVAEKLREEGFLEKQDDSYSHSVVSCYKCGKDLEPITTPNWFIKVDSLKEKVKDAVEGEKVKFYPKRFKKHMNTWLSVMHDWPISRQIVWGIRIPVWYEITKESEKKIYVSFLDTNNNPHYMRLDSALKDGFSLSEIKKGIQNLIADPDCKYTVSVNEPKEGNYLPETDTFDTWFSSGQWPLVTLTETERQTRFPTDFLGTLSDILKFWVSRMIMFSLYLTNEIPFKDVYLWSMVADSKGVKMSKSKGNVINPIDLTDKYGADSLRMSLLFGTQAGGKVILAEDKVRGMRNFSNKVWNAGRYVLERENPTKIDGSYDTQFDVHINEVKEKVTSLLEKYQIGQASEIIYSEIWHWFCDICIEKHKKGEISNELFEKGYISLLTLLHPFMPFVTEQIWQEGRHKRADLFDSPLLINRSW